MVPFENFKLYKNDKKYWFSSNHNLSLEPHFYNTFVILGVQSVDIISMDIPQVAESGKSLVLDCRFEYRYTVHEHV